MTTRLCATAVLLAAAALPADVTKKSEAIPETCLRGQVKIEGQVPKNDDLGRFFQRFGEGERQALEKDGTSDRVWRVGLTGGVGNVVVWLKSADGKPLPKPPAQTWPDELVVRMPSAHFEPRVSVLFPDGGQKLRIVNDSPVPRNVHVHYAEPAAESWNVMLMPRFDGGKAPEMAPALKP